MTAPLDLSVVGWSGLKKAGGRVNEEFHPRLRGKKAAQVYREMRDNDATVGAVFNGIETLVRQVSWQPTAADDSPRAQQEKDYLAGVLDDMSMSWTDTVADMFSMLVYGWSYLEKVYKKRQGETGEAWSRFSDGRIGLRKLELRKQETLDKWAFDKEGGISGMWQEAERGSPILVPIEKSVLCRTTVRANNPEGRSLLRNAYRSYYLLKRLQEIEAIGLERDIAGLPVLEVPPEVMDPGSSASSNRSDFEKIVQEIRMDERMGLLLPSSVDRDGNPTGYKFSLLSASGKNSLALESAIVRYEQSIARTLNANFVTIGNQVGSFALDKNKTEFFILTLHALLDAVADVLNRFVVKDLMILNGVPEQFWPTLSHGDITQSSLEELAQFIQGLGPHITPNKELETELLRRADLPLPVEEEPKELGDESLSQRIGVGGTQSLVEIVRSVHAKEIPVESGVNMIVALFGLPEDQAATIIGEVEETSTDGGELSMQPPPNMQPQQPGVPPNVDSESA